MHFVLFVSSKLSNCPNTHGILYSHFVQKQLNCPHKHCKFMLSFHSKTVHMPLPTLLFTWSGHFRETVLLFFSTVSGVEVPFKTHQLAITRLVILCS